MERTYESLLTLLGTVEQKGIKIELRHIVEGHQKYSLEKYVRKQDDGSSTLWHITYFKRVQGVIKNKI